MNTMVINGEERRVTDSTNIYYESIDGDRECVQFDSHDEHELAELWWEFCKENNFISLEKGKADYIHGTMYEYLNED